MTPTGTTDRLPLRGKQLREVAAILSYLSESGAEARLVHKTFGPAHLADGRPRDCQVQIEGRLGAITKRWTVGPRGGVRNNAWAAR